MKVHLCALIFIFAGAYALVGNECESDSECDAGECCWILSEFQIVSKRDVDPKNGTCQPYLVQGQYCDGVEEMNGKCGCGPGLSCHIYERPISNGKRGYPWRPGYEWISECDQ